MSHYKQRTFKPRSRIKAHDLSTMQWGLYNSPTSTIFGQHVPSAPSMKTSAQKNTFFSAFPDETTLKLKAIFLFFITKGFDLSKEYPN